MNKLVVFGLAFLLSFSSLFASPITQLEEQEDKTTSSFLPWPQEAQEKFKRQAPNTFDFILSFLPIQEIGKFMRVSKEWQQLTEHNLLRRRDNYIRQAEQAGLKDADLVIDSLLISNRIFDFEQQFPDYLKAFSLLQELKQGLTAQDSQGVRPWVQLVRAANKISDATIALTINCSGDQTIAESALKAILTLDKQNLPVMREAFNEIHILDRFFSTALFLKRLDDPSFLPAFFDVTCLSIEGLSNGIFPTDIEYLEKLEFINCTFTHLTSLPPHLRFLTNLRNLKCSFNQLTTLPPQIRQLKKLRELHLNDNKLTSLPREIKQLTNLKEFNGSKNNFLEEEKQKIKDMLPVGCRMTF